MIEEAKCARFENLNELINGIDMGLDIEFVLYGKRYNISTNKTPFIALCPDGEGQHYRNGKDMVEHHQIDGRLLRDSWQDFEILFM